jgi:DNA-binding winged helix-turn-helix (wHTH) protein
MRYAFDDFTLDTGRFELARGGEVVRVEPQVVELLALLVAHCDRMVSKDEINDAVWQPGRFGGGAEQPDQAGAPISVTTGSRSG